MERQEYIAFVFEWLKKRGYDLQADDYSWYGPYCQVVERYTHGKLTLDEILTATDLLVDALKYGLPGFSQLALARDDRIRGQMRAMEFLEATKGKLDIEEKMAFAFCNYYYTFTRVYDEVAQRVMPPFREFESFEKIDAAYRAMREPGSLHAALFALEAPKPEGRFGHSPDNPICVISVPAEYAYLRRLVRDDGTPHKLERHGSVGGPNGSILDLWIDECNEVNGKLYIDAYASANSTEAPEGWKLV